MQLQFLNVFIYKTAVCQILRDPTSEIIPVNKTDAVASGSKEQNKKS